MKTLQEFRCEICRRITSNPDHWFVIQCRDAELTVVKWNFEAANAAGARHFCGEAHAQVHISRWFEFNLLAAEVGFHKKDNRIRRREVQVRRALAETLTHATNEVTDLTRHRVPSGSSLETPKASRLEM